MSDFIREAELRAGRSRSQPDRGRLESLSAEVARLWPVDASRRDAAGLPASVFATIAPGREQRRIRDLADSLDRLFPGWTELAAAAIAEAPSGDLSSQLQHLCVLLARRPLRQPELLLRALERCSSGSRIWILAGLTGSDTSMVRSAWLTRLRQWVAFEDRADAPATWFAFLHALLGRWLTWGVFRDCLIQGQVLTAAAPDGGYRPALERLGVWSHPAFAKWYRQVVYEIVHQPDAHLSFSAGSWITDFPGKEYLRSALDELDRRPDSWWPLHILRWTSLEDAAGDEVQRELKQHSALVLSLVSFIRPDLCAAVGDALSLPHHAEAIAWLRSAGPRDPLDLPWIDRVLRPWIDAAGDGLITAAGALCSTDPPEDFPGPDQPHLRRRAFVCECLVPDFSRAMDNLLYVHALRRKHFHLLADQAQRGLPNALRALALWPEQAEAAAPILFRRSRSGRKVTREAASWALQILLARSGASDLSQLEKRVDLAAAWGDAGLEGKSARAWWDVGGYHVRLTVDAGKAKVLAYSSSGRLASLPAAVRADPQYAEIRRSRADLSRSYRYFRERFEQAMAAGVQYAGRDFAVLLANPVVRSLAGRLVLLADGCPLLMPPSDPLASFSPPDELASAGSVSVAHPVELLQAGLLDEWQRRVIDERIAQPLKQVFREAYVLAEGERDSAACARFAGHPLVARRAFALLRQRGYMPRDGDAVKEWQTARVRAHIEWAAPEEDAGKQLGLDDPQPVTTRALWFERDGDQIALEQVPPVIFSETMRDADLLVSRAAAGELGFTSEETRRLRATLVRYLARALGITTIYVSGDDTHVIVEGKRAMYRVHLGSGSVLLERSRLHLDLGSVRAEYLEAAVAESVDSFTARVLGIIGALSHDDQIDDPQFLAQLANATPGPG